MAGIPRRPQLRTSRMDRYRLLLIPNSGFLYQMDSKKKNSRARRQVAS